MLIASPVLPEEVTLALDLGQIITIVFIIATVLFAWVASRKKTEKRLTRLHDDDASRILSLEQRLQLLELGFIPLYDFVDNKSELFNFHDAILKNTVKSKNIGKALMSLEERVEYLRELGVDIVFNLKENLEYFSDNIEERFKDIEKFITEEDSKQNNNVKDS